MVAYENQTAFLSLSRRGAETADLLLRFGRELIACNVLRYDMRFSVLSLIHVVLRIHPSSVVHKEEHTANLEITQGV